MRWHVSDTHSKSDSCHASIIRRCEQDDSLVPTKRLHDVVRNNGCRVTTAGFSGDNTPLVVYPLVVEWADRMVFHIEYGSHRHNILFSFLLAQTAMESILQMFLQWGVKFNLRTMRRSNAPAEENALFVKKPAKRVHVLQWSKWK